MLMHKCARYTTKFLILCATVVAMTLAGSVPAAAQYTTGSLGGTVVDQTGALVPEAKLTVQNADTSFTQSVSTGADGAFLFPRLAVGNYKLTVEKAGFARSEERRVGKECRSRWSPYH